MARARYCHVAVLSASLYGDEALSEGREKEFREKERNM